MFFLWDESGRRVRLASLGCVKFYLHVSLHDVILNVTVVWVTLLFVFWSFLVLISAWGLAILAEGFRGFLKSLQATAR
jgi:hypothetical protein